MKKIACLAVLGIFAAIAQAGFLPESSYYDGGFYDIENDILINFAVYDTELYPEDFTYTLPGNQTGKFVYAYQITNYNTETDINIFSVFGIGENSIIADDVIGFVDPGNGEIGPVLADFNDDLTRANWTFAPGLLADETSFFLFYSSDSDFVEGEYSFNQNNDGLPVSDDGDIPVPEPASLLLLALGGSVLLRRN
jgi:hypothetical protein